VGGLATWWLPPGTSLVATPAIAALILVFLLPGQRAPGSSQSHAGPPRRGIAVPKAVRVREQNSLLRDALVRLFKQAGVRYRIDPRLRRARVTAHLDDVPFETALRVLLRTATANGTQPTYTVEIGVYVIRAGKSLPLPARTTAPP
jgi:hypothetical protein